MESQTLPTCLVSNMEGYYTRKGNTLIPHSNKEGHQGEAIDTEPRIYHPEVYYTLLGYYSETTVDSDVTELVQALQLSINDRPIFTFTGQSQKKPDTFALHILVPSLEPVVFQKELSDIYLKLKKFYDEYKGDLLLKRPERVFSIEYLLDYLKDYKYIAYSSLLPNCVYRWLHPPCRKEVGYTPRGLLSLRHSIP